MGFWLSWLAKAVVEHRSIGVLPVCTMYIRDPHKRLRTGLRDRWLAAYSS
jgi:hypothetical protein